MFHKAIKLEFKKGTELEIVFQNGVVKRYNIAELFPKYPQLEALRDRKLFCSGKLMGMYGIVWNDELDLEAETVYQDGVIMRSENVSASMQIGSLIGEMREEKGLTQTALAKRTGIDQSGISKIERGVANPSVSTLERIADAMGVKWEFSLK